MNRERRHKEQPIQPLLRRDLNLQIDEYPKEYLQDEYIN